MNTNTTINEVIKNLLLEIKGIIDRTGEGVGIYDITKLAQKYNVTLEEGLEYEEK